MPLLRNPRHERFAEALASGRPTVEAYVHAGYAADPANAARLRRSPEIMARVEELQAAVARRLERREAKKAGRSIDRTEMSVAQLTEMLLADWELARELKQMSAAISALEKLGKLHGLFVDRAVNVNTNYVLAHEPVTDAAEWLARHRPN